MSKEKAPKVVYAVYDTDGYFDDIAFVTAYKSNAIEFILQRNSDPKYKLLTIDKKEHAKRVWEYAYEHSLFGELVGDLIFTDSEYQYLSESYIQLVQDLSYTLEDKLNKTLKYIKLCDEERKIMEDFIKLLSSKLDMIYETFPTDDGERTIDEDDVFIFEKVAEYFFKENIL